ncbi:MAG: hypothetical protein K9J79_03640, partial [Desulfobacteraceae bacterium]|nr:hypothetical protein [Desulfobacteraceae bacterium]
MKRILIGILVSGFVLAWTVAAFAGGAVNKNNLSVEYLRTMNRGATTNSADIAAYNPAGTVVLEDGLYLNTSVQHLKKEYVNIIGGTEYETDEPSTVPELYT